MEMPIGCTAPIDEDQALRILLQQDQSHNEEEEFLRQQDSFVEVPEHEAAITISGHTGWSSSDTPEHTYRRRDTIQSYDAMLESLNLLSGSCIRTPDVDDFLKRFSKAEEEPLEKDDFEPIPSAPVSFKTRFSMTKKKLILLLRNSSRC